MINQPSFANTPDVKDQTDAYDSPLLANIRRLKSKLQGAQVVGSDNQTIGVVKDLMIDSNQNLNLVVTQLNPQNHDRCILLNSKLIQRVSTQTQSVFVNITQLDVSYLPDYFAADQEQTSLFSNQVDATAQHPVSQLPAESAVAGMSASPAGMQKRNDDETVVEYPSVTKEIAGEANISSHPTLSPSTTLDSSNLARAVAAPELVSPELATDLTAAPSLQSSHPDGLPSHPAPMAFDSAAPDKHAVATDADVREVTTFALLEERLKTDYKRRKLGEVVIRKKIETRMVEVPVRYEKLLIEQVGPEPGQLAEVDLFQGGSDADLMDDDYSVVSGHFTSPKAASQVLDAIAKTLRHRCKSVRIEIELDDPQLRSTYQEWIDKYSQS